MQKVKTTNIGFNLQFRALALIALTLGLVFIIGGLTPLVFTRPPPLTVESSTIPVMGPAHETSLRTLNKQFNLSEGSVDIAGFAVADDGSLVSTLISAGEDVGDFQLDAPRYQECVIAMTLFRWGEYQEAFGYLIEILLNETGNGDGVDLEPLYEYLNLLPPNVLIMLFMGGEALEQAAWANEIHLEFELTLALPFEPVTEIPPLVIGEISIAFHAYAYYGTEIEGRDGFQSYMAGRGSTRRGAMELVTPTLADDSDGGVGICGIINIGAFAEPVQPMKAVMQVPQEVLVAAGWVSLHKDKFYGTEENEFNVNEFCGRTGTISMGSLDAFEFTMLFPAGVNITELIPSDMYNTSSPQGVIVGYNSTQWGTGVNNIIVRFEGSFPPGLSITKEINPIITPGTAAQVTITLSNIDPSQTVHNIVLDDSESWSHYTGLAAQRITVVGETSDSWSSLAPGDNATLTYQIIISTEGSYIFDRANVTFEDEIGAQFEKHSNKVFVVVRYASVFEFLFTIFRDIPWSIPIIVILGLLLLYLVIGTINMIRGYRTKKVPPPPPEYEPTTPPSEPMVDEEPLPPPEKMSEVVCVNCGSPVPKGVAFCPACGAKV